MIVLLLLLVFVFGAGLAVMLFLGASRVPQAMAERRVQARIDSISRTDEEEEARRSAVALIKGTVEGPFPSLDRFFGTSARGASLSAWIRQSGMEKATVSGVLLVSCVLAAAFAFGGSLVLRGVPGMAIGAVTGFALPFLLLSQKRTKRMRKFEEQFPEALDLISRALKAGHAFANGMKMAADELPEPVGPEFRKTFDEQNFGLPLKDALLNLAGRVPILDVRFFATAVLIQRETGGNLSEILENLAHVVRERFKILRQVRVYTAHGRLTGYVLLALPFALAIALSFISPEHMELLFRERMGQTMLVGAMISQIIGYFWIRQVVKIEV